MLTQEFERLLWVCASLVWVLGLPVVASPQIERLADQQKYKQVIESCSEILKENPRDAYAFRMRGWAEYCTSSYDKAIKDCSEAIRIEPTVARAYRYRACALYGKTRFQEAIDDATTSIKLDPTGDPQSYDIRGGCSLSLRKYIEAIADFDVVLKSKISRKEEAARCYVYRASAYYQLGQYQKTGDDYTHAIAIEPSNYRHYLERGEAYWRSKNFEKAINDFDRALLIKPADSGLLWWRGITYGSMQKYQEEINDLSEAIRLDPSYNWAYTNCGWAYLQMGQYRMALKACNIALKVNPSDATAFTYRAFAYSRLGEKDKAIQDFSRAIELDPKKVSAYEQRGFEYQRKGEYARSISDLNHAIALDPHCIGCSLMYRNRAWSYIMSGEVWNALPDYIAALDGFASKEEVAAFWICFAGFVILSEFAVAPFSGLLFWSLVAAYCFSVTRLMSFAIRVCNR